MATQLKLSLLLVCFGLWFARYQCSLCSFMSHEELVVLINHPSFLPRHLTFLKGRFPCPCSSLSSRKNLFLLSLLLTCGDIVSNPGPTDKVNCVCESLEESGLMLQCDSCLCWSHCKCVSVLPQVAEKFPFIFPFCIKSIFSLVPSLRSEISHFKDHINSLESSYKSITSIPSELNAVPQSLSSLSNKVTSIAQVCIPSIPGPIYQSPHTPVPVPSPKSSLNPVSDPISSNSNSHLAITLANPLSYPIEPSSSNFSNPSSGHPQPKPPLFPLPTFPPSSQPPFLSNRSCPPRKPPLLQHPPPFPRPLIPYPPPRFRPSCPPYPPPHLLFPPPLPIYSTHPPPFQPFNPPSPAPYHPHHVQHPSNSLNSALLNLLALLIPQMSLLPNFAGQSHYFNARNIFPKLDEVSALCSVHHPDIVCIVETWLSGSISDSELSLPDFQLFRCDRNRHGGGILVYTKSSLLVLPIPISPDIEFLLLSIKKGHHTFSVGTFYRPPSSPHDLYILHDTLSALNPSYLLNFILIGDFNVDVSNYLSPLFHKVSVFSDSFSLHQIIRKATHYSNSGSPSIINLVFIPTSFQLCPYSILPPALPRRVWLYDQVIIS